MKLNDISKAVTAAQLNENLAEKFGERVKIEAFTLEQLENVRNKVRTKMSQIETNESFDAVGNEDYQKNKMFLDVLNAAISERAESTDDKAIDEANFEPDDIKNIENTKDIQKARALAMQAVKGKNGKSTIAANKQQYFARQINNAPSVLKIVELLYQMLLSGEGLGTIGSGKSTQKSSYRQNYESAKAAGKVLSEGEEDKAQLIMASKDMVDRLTGWMEDTAEMQTESMLELADAIRDELGSEQSEAFTGAVRPSLESLYLAMEQTRIALTSGVGLLTGENDGMGMMGAEDEMGTDMEPTTDMDLGDVEDPMAEPVDDLDAVDPIDDEFGAASAADGGEAPMGREKRESRSHKREMLESSRRLAGILTGSPKKK